MGYAVDIQMASRDLGDQMSRMRTWLHRQGVEPSSFRFSSLGQAQTVCVRFNVEADASAFATQFAGTMRPRQ